MAVREAVQPAAPARGFVPITRADELATRLIVRWEVTSPATYTRSYEGVIWPGGASGPTWGIGYDGGHQTRLVIEQDWKAHPQVLRLVATSSITGQEARTRLPEWRGVRTPYSLAEQVFTQASLPQYQRAARRAVGPGYDDLSPGAQAALASLGYNRGWSILGNRRIQMRKIAKVCVPARDEPCIARELRDMCQLWAGTPNGAGLCARRNDEARSVERG